MKEIILKKGKEESLGRRHPWVFSGAIARMPDDIAEGEWVEVRGNDGRLLGCGHYQIGSITVRLLTFENEPIEDTVYEERIHKAFRLRKDLGLIRPDNNCFRLVHGEGDFLPGLVVDIYGDTAVMQAHSPGMHKDRHKIADAIVAVPEAKIRNVYYKSEGTLPFMAKLDPQNGYIIGHYEDNIAIENGLQFGIDWLKGQKTGFFLDQRDNRKLLERYAAGRDVLNMFCYTGGFSVYALRGGAERVVSVDSSSKAIALTEANVALNFPDKTNHTAVATDVFRFLDDIKKDEFDLIILDPPAFAKHKNALKNGLIGYRRLNAKAFEKIRPGGIIFTFSCSQVVSREQFRLAVFSAAAQSKRRVRILHQLTQPADHPIDFSHPEGEYLKGLVLFVE